MPLLAGLVQAREITHAMGTTVVPDNPQRIVVLDGAILDTLVAIGKLPVGAAGSSANGTFPAYLAGQAAGIELVGSVAEPELERIAALGPDMIISSKQRHEGLYDTLSQIAPTVYLDQLGLAWKDNVLTIGEFVGASEEAQAALDAYAARTEQIGATLDADGRLVSLVRFRPDQIRLYSPYSYAGQILTDIGFTVSNPGQVTDQWLVVSPEQLDIVDADAIFVTTSEAGKPGNLYDNPGPLWESMAAVKSGNVHAVDPETWIMNGSILCANLVLDDVLRFLQ